MRRSEIGTPLRHGFNLPSDNNFNFVYGKKSKNSESFHDVIHNNYGKEWTLDLEDKKKKEDLQVSFLENQKLNKKRNEFSNELRLFHLENGETKRSDFRKTCDNFSSSKNRSFSIDKRST